MTTIKAAVRSLVRAPGFSTLVVVTLALGIGATTAMFAVVDTAVINPLRYPGADRFAEVAIARRGEPPTPNVPGTMAAAVRDQLAEVGAVEGYQYGSAVVAGGAEPEVVSAPAITPGLLARTGAVPIAGRLFNDDDVRAGSRVALIGERLWVRQFGGDPTIVGRQVTMDDEPTTIVGVLSARYRYPLAMAGAWRPLDLAPAKPSRRGLDMILVRDPGVSIAQLTDRLAAASRSLGEAKVLPDGATLDVVPLVQLRYGRQESLPYWLALGAVGLLLAVACVNVMGLFLVRSSSRYRELAVHSALGASRAELVKAVVAEAAVLSAVAGLLGAGLAGVILRVMQGTIPPQFSTISSVGDALDWRSAAVAVAIASTTCLACGLLPAWRASRVSTSDAIKQRATNLIGGADDRWQGLLIAAQFALVLVLLSGAALLARSLHQWLAVDPGFRVEGLVAVDVGLATKRYPQGGQALLALREIAARLEQSAPVDVTLASGAPVTAANFSFSLEPQVEGGSAHESPDLELPWTHVDPDYFSTVGIPFEAGRTFLPGEQGVAVINTVMARRWWGATSPLGRRFRLRPDDEWHTVVGVVGDVRESLLDNPHRAGMEFYVPPRRDEAGGYWSIIVRSTLAAPQVAALVKEVLWQRDPRAPVLRATPVSERLASTAYRQRFATTLASWFAGLSVLIAAVGVYGVTAYWLARRRRELAIRIAIGATRARVMRLVLARVTRLTLAGTLLGLAVAVASMRLISPLLYKTSPTDPLTFAGVSVLLAVLALAATATPAARACRVDPNVELRSE